MNLFESDSIFKGLLIGTLLPAILFGMIYITIISVSDIVTERFYENSTLLFIALNGITVRYFMIKKDQEKTGKGILVITFILMLLWVILFQI